MQFNKKSAPGSLTWPRAAVAVLAATLSITAISEASARSRHHHKGHHHHHAKNDADNFHNANAAIGSGGGRSFSGVASFYGNESGSKTASGQRFNQNAMTAAHRTLPFGTKVRVTHGSSSVVVTINDRGPFIKGRVIDLSKGAASAIGLTSRGVGKVYAEVL